MSEQDLTNWIKETGIYMRTSRVPENPLMNGGMPEGSAHFHVTLKCDDKSFCTYYSVGPGIIEHWVKAKYPMVRSKLKGLNPKTVLYQETLQQNSGRYAPSIEDVLQCLHSDFVGIQDYCGFEDWAECFGYDTDSREAERTYNICLKQCNEFCRIVGSQAFQKFSELEADW